MKLLEASRRLALGTLAVLLVAACGASATDVEPPTAAVNLLALRIQVSPGKEAHVCQLHRMPDAPYVVGLRHESTRGGHHLVLRRTTLPGIPPSLREAFDCDSQASLSLPVGGVLYSAQASTGALMLPPGVGLPITAGEIVLLESHVMNPSSAPLDVTAKVELATSAGADVRSHAGVLAFSAPFIHVTPRSRAEASLGCPIGADITLVSAVGAMSRRGAEFRAFQESPDALATAPFYTSGAWDHPTTLAKDTSLPAGSRLRIRCGYDALNEREERFQGPGPEDERCTFSGLYYPASPLVDERCTAGPDRFGTGRSTCAAALACAEACQPGGAAGSSRVDPCIQRCVASSCPAAGRALVEALACTPDSCPSLRAACVQQGCG